MKKIVNGGESSLTPPSRKQRGMDEVFEPRVTTEALRQMDHADWLESFSKVMRLQTGVEMTPMRAGVISRLNLASQYIRLVKIDVLNALKQIEQQQKLLIKADKKIKDQESEIDSLRLDQTLDQHEESR